MIEKYEEKKEKNKKKEIVTFFSHYGGVGKTTLAVNMAKVFANEGKKTIVLEFDLFKPTIKEMLNLKVDVYFTNCLRAIFATSFPEVIDNFIEKCVVKHETGIDFMVAEPNYNPITIREHTSLFTNEQFFDYLMGFMYKLQKQYDVIIIDTPSTLELVSLHTLLLATRPILVVPPSSTIIKKSLELVASLPSHIQLKPIDLIVNNSRNNTRRKLAQLKEDVLSMKEVFYINEVLFLDFSENVLEEYEEKQSLFINGKKNYRLYHTLVKYALSITRKERSIALPT